MRSRWPGPRVWKRSCRARAAEAVEAELEATEGGHGRALELKKGTGTMARKSIHIREVRGREGRGRLLDAGRDRRIDPTFIRIGFVAAAIFTSFKWTLVAYAAIGVYLALQKKRAMQDERGPERFRAHG